MDDDLVTLPGIRVLAPAWQQCLLLFLRQVYERSRSQGTIKTYLSIFTHFFAVYTAPERVTRQQVELFIGTSFSGRGQVSTNTRNSRLTALSAFYKYAGTFMLPDSTGILTPLLRTPPPTAGIRRGKAVRNARALTAKELDRLFAAIPTNTVQGLRDRAIYLLYFWTARRRMEIARLRWGDIFEGTILDEHGNQREGWLYHFTGKGHSQEIDTAELPAPAKAAIDRYLVASGRMETITADEPLFLPIGPRLGGGRPRRQTALSADVIADNLKVYARAAGLDPARVHLHALRHSSAQMHYLANPDIRATQHLLRHASSSTTDLYLESLRGTADPALPVLEKRFGHLSKF
jgi:integrase/recombinase XerD